MYIHFEVYIHVCASYPGVSEVDENWAIMVVHQAIFTYPTMEFYFWLAPEKCEKPMECVIYPEYPLSRSDGIIYPSRDKLRNRQFLVLRDTWSACIIASKHLRSMPLSLPITELKWDARTVTDILGNNAYWYFAFFWLTKRSRSKN